MIVDYGGSYSKQRLPKITILDGICGPFHDDTVDGYVTLGESQYVCCPNSTTIIPTGDEEWLRTRQNLYVDITESNQK